MQYIVFITFTINISHFFLRVVHSVLKTCCMCCNITGQTQMNTTSRVKNSAYRLSISMPVFPQPLQLQCLNNYRDRHSCQSVYNVHLCS